MFKFRILKTYEIVLRKADFEGKGTGAEVSRLRCCLVNAVGFGIARGWKDLGPIFASSGRSSHWCSHGDHDIAHLSESEILSIAFDEGHRA